MEGPGFSRRSEDEGGTSVENGGAVSEDAIAINGNTDRTLPETFLVDVLESDKGAGVELGPIKTSERNLAIVETVGNSRNLVRRDGLVDQPLLRESLNGGRDTLVGNGRLGCAQEAVELSRVVGEFLGFDMSNTKGVVTQSQAGDLDVVSDDGPVDGTRTISNRPGRSGVFESGRRTIAEEDVIALGSRTVSEQTVVGVNRTHTTATTLGLTILSADPKVSRTAIHQDGKITWRGADLNSGNVSDVVPSVRGY